MFSSCDVINIYILYKKSSVQQFLFVWDPLLRCRPLIRRRLELQQLEDQNKTNKQTNRKLVSEPDPREPGPSEPHPVLQLSVLLQQQVELLLQVSHFLSQGLGVCGLRTRRPEVEPDVAEVPLKVLLSF